MPERAIERAGADHVAAPERIGQILAVRRKREAHGRLRPRRQRRRHRLLHGRRANSTRFASADVRHIARVEQMRAEAGADGRVGALTAGRPGGAGFPLAPGARPAGRARRRAVAIDTSPSPATAGELVGWLVDRIVRLRCRRAATSCRCRRSSARRATSWFEALVRSATTTRCCCSRRSISIRWCIARRDAMPMTVFDAPPPQPTARPSRWP